MIQDSNSAPYMPVFYRRSFLFLTGLHLEARVPEYQHLMLSATLWSSLHSPTVRKLVSTSKIDQITAARSSHQFPGASSEADTIGSHKFEALEVPVAG